VRLGASTHAPDMLNCLNGHHAILCENSSLPKNLVWQNGIFKPGIPKRLP
jgi:hypothetical protein